MDRLPRSHVIPIYAGFDEREEAGYHVFASSVIEHASAPVGILPLHLPMFRRFYRDGSRDGTTAFIYTRFLVPFLQDYQGWAIFADGADMLCRGDIADLWALRDDTKAVQVAKHDYKTKHPRKYVGTAMEADNRDYPAKNWSSVMLINCGHPGWRSITPSVVAEMTGAALHRFAWLPDRVIGDLPLAWNWLADEYGPNPDAQLLHWTAGVPAFPEYRNAPHFADFERQAARVNHVTE